MMNWKEYFRRIAQEVKLKSNDIFTKTGVVIVDCNDMILSTGYNSIPISVKNTEGRQMRPEKYYWFIHAETSAIVKAAKLGISIDGATMYMTCDIPCTDCAKVIINSGIKKIVCERGGGSKSDIWKEHRIRSLRMFEESGIVIEYYD